MPAQFVELTNEGGYKLLVSLKWNGYLTNALLAGILLCLLTK